MYTVSISMHSFIEESKEHAEVARLLWLHKGAFVIAQCYFPINKVFDEVIDFSDGIHNNYLNYCTNQVTSTSTNNYTRGGYE